MMPVNEETERLLDALTWGLKKIRPKVLLVLIFLVFVAVVMIVLLFVNTGQKRNREVDKCPNHCSRRTED